MVRKVKVAIIGTGNIGTDILMKLQRSDILECSMFTGRNPDSIGIKIAKDLGIRTSFNSVDAIIKQPDCCDIIFDATSANVHRLNAPILKKLNKFTIDLTPARVGKMCVPVINLDDCLVEDNVNLITCGGQATIPIAYAISKVCSDIRYLEVIASISSMSAGLGTRNNIDEFTQTTRDALTLFTEVSNTKAIIVLNSAEPPITMRNTLYALIDNPDMNEIRNSIHEMVKQIKKYVPGYHLAVEPTFENGRVTTIIEVIGQGDYLPKYSGNLDIITCSAIEIAEQYAITKIMGGKVDE